MDDRPEPDLAHVLSEIARSLDRERTMEGLLRAVALAAVRAVPGARHASVTAAGWGGGPDRTARTDETAAGVDRLQSEAGVGPSIEAVRSRSPYVVPDLAADDRWPAFGPRVIELGVRSVLAVPLLVEAGDLGAITLYAGSPGALRGRAEYVAPLLAAHSAVALAASRRECQLTEALESRDVIGQAKGILVERHGATRQQAFQLLVETSQRTNIKLREVSEYLVGTREGTTPGPVPVAAGRRRRAPSGHTRSGPKPASRMDSGAAAARR